MHLPPQHTHRPLRTLRHMQTPQTMNAEDRTALELAGATYKYPAIRETHAREQLGLGPVEFWKKVNALLDDPRAEAEMPLVVRRLKRMRQARRDVRSARRLSG